MAAAVFKSLLLILIFLMLSSMSAVVIFVPLYSHISITMVRKRLRGGVVWLSHSRIIEISLIGAVRLAH